MTQLVRLASTLAAFFALALPVSAAEFTMKFGTATFNDTQHQWINLCKEALAQAPRAASRSRSFHAANRPDSAQDRGPAARHHRGIHRPAGFLRRRRSALRCLSAPGLFIPDLDHAFRTVQDPEFFFFRHYMSIGDA